LAFSASALAFSASVFAASASALAFSASAASCAFSAVFGVAEAAAARRSFGVVFDSMSFLLYSSGVNLFPSESVKFFSAVFSISVFLASRMLETLSSLA
jgi:hypothetical protein